MEQWESGLERSASFQNNRIVGATSALGDLYNMSAFARARAYEAR